MAVPQSYDVWLAEVRRKYLIEVLCAAKYNQCRAAEIMGMHRNTVKRMLEMHGLSSPEIRRMRLDSMRRKFNPNYLKNGAVQHHA